MEFRLIQHEIVDSTSERAFSALSSGTARNGDVHVARGQTRGRGRLGARWISPAGEGLYLSIVLLPPPPPLHPAGLTMAAGLGVLAALRSLGLSAATLEWPNDVLVSGAKIAGILVETRGLDPARPHYVLGLGINVLQRSFPPELLAERPVTSLALAGCEAGVEACLNAVLASLPERLDSLRRAPGSLAQAFLEATGLCGRRVRVNAGSRAITGVLRNISLDEGLLLELGQARFASLQIEHVRAVEAIE